MARESDVDDASCSVVLHLRNRDPYGVIQSDATLLAETSETLEPR